VVRGQSETTVKLPVRVPRLSRNDSDEPPRMRLGIVPSSHSLEVEAGMLSGYYALYRCTAACDEPQVSARTMANAGRQLAVPFAGLRYVYYRFARSRETPFRAKQRFLLGADVLTRPIDNPAAGLQNVRGKVIEQSPVGGRVAIQFPGFQKNPNSLAMSMDLTLGYLPSPSDVIVHASLALF
jgi:hypothetical protein